MGVPFGDITVYASIPFPVRSTAWNEMNSLINFVSDFYVQNMNGYKPPKTTRITIQPYYHGIWNRTWKNGSIVTIAPFFSYEEFSSFDKIGKYKYILDLIQTATIQLSEEYEWDRSVFENAYKKTLESNFEFNIRYPSKQSKDRKKIGTFVVAKTDTITSAYVEINNEGIVSSHKLFDKNNLWCYDGVYVLARNSKWFDNQRFGVTYKKREKLEAWFALDKNQVELFENGDRVSEIDFLKYFIFG